MPIRHLLLALLVVIVWGVNFLFVKFCLHEISPLLLCTLRFSLASLPAILFIKPPSIPFRSIALYGIVMFALQFGLFFLGMRAGMTAGMASLIMQIQVFFSMILAAVYLGEYPKPLQVGGAFISFAGIAIVGLHFDNDVSALGFILILGASISWGIGNLITRKNLPTDMIALVVWGSFIAFIPMLFLTLWFEGPAEIISNLNRLTWVGGLSLFYIVYVATWIGYGAWNWLLSVYPVGTIVPFTLLIPVVGMLSSVIVLGEPLQNWKILSGILVISGLGVSFISNRYKPHPSKLDFNLK